jgi:hypothetical protein
MPRSRTESVEASDVHNRLFAKQNILPVVDERCTKRWFNCEEPAAFFDHSVCLYFVHKLLRFLFAAFLGQNAIWQDINF